MKNGKDVVAKKHGIETKAHSKNQEILKKKQHLIAKKSSKLFIKKGYSQTTMREISKATGINLGNLYNFIDSKEDILCLVFNTFHAPANEWFAQSGILELDDPEKQLRTVVRKLLEIIHHYKNDILMMYRETNVLPPKFMKIVLGKESALVGVIEEIIRKGIEKQVFKVRDAFFAANMLIYQLSLYPLRSWNMKKYTEDEVFDLIEESIFEAIIKN